MITSCGGRSGRQGDPGKSRFYVSLEDDLMRIFGQGLDTWLKRFGIGDDEAIEHQWITNAIAKAQERREGYNFDIRKQLIRYDDVLNDQRQAYSELRDEVLDEEDLTEKLEDMRGEGNRGLGWPLYPAVILSGAMGLGRSGERFSGVCSRWLADPKMGGGRWR